jgi:hypothetical protein
MSDAPSAVVTQALNEGLFRLVRHVPGFVEDVRPVRPTGTAERWRFGTSLQRTNLEKPVKWTDDVREEMRGASPQRPDRRYRVARGYEVEMEVVTSPLGAKVDVRVEGDGAKVVAPYAASAGKPGRFTVRFDTFSRDAQDTRRVVVTGLGEPFEIPFVVSPFQSIWAEYPDQHYDEERRTHEPCEALDKGDSQCAARMSEAIERGGFSLKRWRGYFCRCGAGTGGGGQHMLRAQEVANELHRHQLSGVKLGARVVRPGKNHHADGVTWKDYEGRTGLVFFRDFWARNDRQKERGFRHFTGDHVDVWNGYKQGSDGFRDPGDSVDYFARSREVWFWPLH